MYDENYLKNTLDNVFKDQDLYNVPEGIRRHDYSNIHGWWVRVQRDKTMFSKLFSDGVHGSIQNSLKEAILYRHEIISSFPVTIKKISNRGLPTDPENRIRRREDKGKLRPYIYWEAKWYDKDHKIKTANFPVFTLGEESAKIKAFEVAKNRHNYKPKISNVRDPYLSPKYEKISRAEVDIWATINNTSSSGGNYDSNIENYEPHGFEGERKFEIHKSIERDRKLRNKKIFTFLQENGKIFCELCKFNFNETYKFLETDIIEVHHIIPLSTLTKSQKISLSDLMLLCSNCHFAIHQGNAEENLIEAMIQFEQK